MLVSVHPVGFLEDWGFGDFQSLRLSPGEHPIQPIEGSQLVPLKGHEFDLEDLPVYLHGYPVQVTKRPDGYFLVLPISVAGSSYDRVASLAADYVALINGAAGLVISSFRPIELAQAGFHGVDENGDVMSTVIPVGTAEARCKGGHLTALVNGVAQPDCRIGQATRLLAASSGNSAAADALAIVGRTTPSWSELYLVYELVESNTGRRMFAEGWISKAEGTRFTRTANSYTALGRSSRHGKQQVDPPSKPMTQPEATVLMRGLVAAWLNSITSAARGAG